MSLSPATRPSPVAKFPAQSAGPSVRILLEEDFRSVRIEDSAQASPLQIQVTGSSVQLIEGRKRRSGSRFRIEPGADGRLSLDGKVYRGAVEIFINPLGMSVIVNELALEDYLKGVVANELDPMAFPHMEAIKAQATAARSYALSMLGQYGRRGFDLYSDERSQVYRGVNSEHPMSNRAVDETRGIIAAYQGEQPIKAFYSSTCGGKTEDYQLVFKQASSIPYLKGGVQCEGSSARDFSWEEKIPGSRIQENLNRKAAVGKLRKLIPIKRGSSGRVVEMLVVGDEGEKVLTGSEIRFALGLPSSLIREIRPSLDPFGNIVELRVRGRGRGHGVGLCQMGSVELAKRGLTFDRILKRYYRGIHLVRRY